MAVRICALSRKEELFDIVLFAQVGFFAEGAVASYQAQRSKMNKKQKKPVNIIKPLKLVKPVAAVQRAVDTVGLKNAVLKEVEMKMKSSAASHSKRKAVSVMNKAVPQKDDDLGAEEQALRTAFSTLHPELSVDARQVDEVATPTGTLKTITRYQETTIANGTHYEMVMNISPFLNDQIIDATAYAGGVVSAQGFADNPSYFAAFGTYSQMRLVSMAVTVVNITNPLSMQGTWVMGNARSSLIPVGGSSFAAYQQIKNFSRGQFTPDNEGNSGRMIWVQSDPADGWFFPIDANYTNSTASQRTSIIVGLNSGNIANSYEIVITCNYEGIVALPSQQLIPTAAVAADPAVHARAISAAGELTTMKPEIVSNPQSAERASHTDLANMAKAAVGVVGDIATGDLAGAAKTIISNLGSVGDVVEDGFSFLADGIGSIFGLMSGPEKIFTACLLIAQLGPDEYKNFYSIVADFEKKGALPDKVFTNFLSSMYKSAIALEYESKQRVPQLVGLSYTDDHGDRRKTSVPSPSLLVSQNCVRLQPRRDFSSTKI